jgi:hypothetical protein
LTGRSAPWGGVVVPFNRAQPEYFRSTLEEQRDFTQSRRFFALNSPIFRDFIAFRPVFAVQHKYKVLKKR